MVAKFADLKGIVVVNVRICIVGRRVNKTVNVAPPTYCAIMMVSTLGLQKTVVSVLAPTDTQAIIVKHPHQA